MWSLEEKRMKENDKSGGKTVNKYRNVTCLLLIALVAVSTLSVMLYQREATLRGDLERLQANYVSLDQSYGQLFIRFEETIANFQVLTSKYINLADSFTLLNLEYRNLTGSFSLLQASYVGLTEKYGELMDSYEIIVDNYSNLTESYVGLQASYSGLTENYVGLQDRYFLLEDLHDQLEGNYTELNTTYLQLQEQYTILYQPLEYTSTPTTEEVMDWLEVDDTDNASYVGGRFTCGDFTVNLMLHAKMNHWRILFSVIEFDFISENPSGAMYHHGLNAHAFASIFTTEGIIYVEPQTDLVFYLYCGWDPETHVEFPEWVFIDTGPWFGTIFVQYYNRMGLEATPIRGESPILTSFFNQNSDLKCVVLKENG